jgi:hypothetical protein
LCLAGHQVNDNGMIPGLMIERQGGEDEFQPVWRPGLSTPKNALADETMLAIGADQVNIVTLVVE